MWLFKIGVVVVKALFHAESALVVEAFAYFVLNVHMQIDALDVFQLTDVLLEILHHMSTGLALPIGLEHDKGEDVSSLHALVILNANCVAADHDVIVEDGTRVLGVLHHELVIETSAVLDRERVIVQLANRVDVVVVDFAVSNS